MISTGKIMLAYCLGLALCASWALFIALRVLDGTT